ncbi:MAG TPA: hypothetical protein VFK40_08000, partial [Nitrososphaeraceae archaeon]|nr:hypothetical protein [Nitrososphaeraceae archaeon]
TDQMYAQGSVSNECSSTSSCNSLGSNSIRISGSTNYASQINSMTNHCNTGSTCTVQSQNVQDIITSQSSIISQNSDSSNFCDSSICFTAIQNTASLSNVDKANVIQNTLQQNMCTSTSVCFIIGSIEGSVNDEKTNKAITQSLSQENYCFYNSKCHIEGSIAQTGGTSTQTNICLLGSDCTNTHANSQLIAIDTICSSDGSGIKVCTPFGIFSVSEFRSNPTQQNYQNSAFEQTAFSKHQINDKENIQAALEEHYGMNDPGFTNLDKAKYVGKDQETFASDQSKPKSIDPSQSSKKTEQTQNSATASVQPKITTEYFNVFDSLGNDLLQSNQGMHHELIIPQIPTNQEIQSDQKSHNTLTNRIGDTYSLGVPLNSEEIQKTLQKFLRMGSNKATLSNNIESNTQNTIILTNPFSLSSSSLPTSTNPGLYNIPTTAPPLQPITINHEVYLSQYSLDNVKSIQNVLNSLLLGKKIS